MPRLQELIHILEVGAGARYLRLAALLLGILTLTVAFDLREFQNMKSEEAMDAAQVARNLAEGRGFTTRYVRPLSMSVIMQHRDDRDPLIKGDHPDLANAPLYPLVLAGFMKIPGLFDHDVVSSQGRQRPDLIIALINQGFFFLSMFLIWLLARRLFDPGVAFLTVLVMLGSELLWQFSASGHSTMLALFLVTVLANVLVRLDLGVRGDPPMGMGKAVVLAAVAGLVCGLLGLTRYSLAVLAIPVVVFLVGAFPGRRAVLSGVAALMFLGTFSPWLVRNWQICGNPFGIAAYSLVQETPHFSDDWLTRSLDPRDTDVGKVTRADIVRKAFVGAGQLLQEDLPQLGGTWLTAFFLVGLFVPFVHPGRGRLRWFTVGALVTLGLAQILARTHLSDVVPRIHSENLLVVLAPLVFLFGAGLLMLLVNSLDLVVDAWRKVILGGAVLVCWLPLIITFGPPRVSPVAYPPYYPPSIQRVAGWFGPDELIMSDMPWAVAWYGDRQSILLSRDPYQSFNDIHDWQKSVSGLYLTQVTLDQRFVTDWVRNGWQWGKFVVDFVTKAQVPDGFPLSQSPDFLSTFPHYLLIADRRRWMGDLPPIRPPRERETRPTGTADPRESGQPQGSD